MIESIVGLKRKAVRMNLCKEYHDKWDKAESMQQLIDIGLDANGIEYMAGTCNTNAGLSSAFMLKNFADFINGAYISRQKGYTAEMFVEQNETLTVNADIALLIGCNGGIEIKKNRCAKIYTDKKCKNVAVSAQKHSLVEIYVFGRDTRVEAKGEGVVNIYRMSRTRGLLQWHVRRS